MAEVDDLIHRLVASTEAVLEADELPAECGVSARWSNYDDPMTHRLYGGREFCESCIQRIQSVVADRVAWLSVDELRHLRAVARVAQAVWDSVVVDDDRRFIVDMGHALKLRDALERVPGARQEEEK